jgi:hypothetical protein
MAYTPPAGSAVTLEFGSGYAAPTGSSVSLEFSDVGGVTGFLSGQRVTLTGGVLTPNLAVVLTGQACTGTQGLIFAATGPSITGQACTGTGGLLVPNLAVILTGQVSATAAGFVYWTLNGLVATTNPGVVGLGDVYGNPLGLLITTTQGSLVPATELVGLRANAIQGPTIEVTSTGVTVGLSHWIAATSLGKPVQQLEIGWLTGTSSGALAPSLSLLQQNLLAGVPLGRLRNSFLPSTQGLSSAGEKLNYIVGSPAFLTNDDAARTPQLWLDQKIHQTYPPTDDGNPLANFDTLISAASKGAWFFPNGFEQGAYVSTNPHSGPFYKYVQTEDRGGFISVDPNGNFHAAWPRISYHLNETWMAWQPGTQHAGYGGLAFRISTGRQNGKPLGIYALSSDTALVFYSRRINTAVTVPNTELVGMRATCQLNAPSVTPVISNESPNGIKITATAGVLTRDPTEAVVVLLDFQRLYLNLGLFGKDQIVAESSTDVTGFAFRTGVEHGLYPVTVLDTAWSPETLVTSVSGVSILRATGTGFCAVPSGYGDIVYAVYTSTSLGAKKIVVTAIDAASRTVLSSSSVVAPTAISYGKPQYRISQAQERSLAEVAKISDGTSLTQFLLEGCVVKLSWTSGIRTTPTLSTKTAPSSVFAGWETLEIRGDEVYHVFADDGDTLTVNDAVSSSSTWSVVPTGFVEFTAPFNIFASDADRWSGYGGGKDSWLFSARAPANPITDASAANVTIWMNFWATQRQIFTVAAKVLLGRVGVNITPNVALTGLRATTASGADSPFPLVNNDAHVWLVGKKLMSARGLLEPPRIVFVLDNFNDTSGVTLTSHTGEVGATWTLSGVHGNTLEINGAGNAVTQHNNSGGGDDEGYWASGIPPSLDYRVDGKISVGSTTQDYAGTPQMAIGARVLEQASFTEAGPGVVTTTGFFFGWNRIDTQWVLKKRGVDFSVILGVYPAAGIGLGVCAIEVQGIFPTRIRCYLGTAVDPVIDVVDNGYQLTYRGSAGLYAYTFDTDFVACDYINGSYLDCTALVPQGQRATLSQGVMTGPWPTGQLATCIAGQLGISLGTDATVALVGLAATTTQGVLFAADYAALVGQVATGIAGIVQPPWFVLLTGMRVTGTPGIASLLNRELPGLVATVRRGDVGWQVDAYPTPAGLRATITSGVLTPTIDKVFVGSAVAATAGLLKVASGVLLAGQAMTAGAGLLAPSTSETTAFTGQSATGTGGAISPVTAEGGGMIGQGVTAGIGTLVPVLTCGLAGAAASTRSGGFIPLLVVTPTGQQAVTAEGTLTVLTNIFLTGRSGTMVPGVLGHTHSCTLYPLGLAMKGYVGDVTQRFQKERLDHDLWFTSADVNQFVEQEVTDEFT